MGVAIPALLDFCCIAIACIAGILLYELHRPLDGRDAWLLWAELSLKYGAAFVILAQAHHLYTQRATLLQVADTARILRVSVYGLTLLSVGNYFTKADMPRLLLTYFWVFSTLLLVMQKYSTSRIIRDWSSLAAHQRRVLICGTTRETRRLFSYLLHSPHLGQIPVGFLDESGFDNRRVIYSHDYNLKHHVPVISEPLSQVSSALSRRTGDLRDPHCFSATHERTSRSSGRSRGQGLSGGCRPPQLCRALHFGADD